MKLAPLLAVLGHSFDQDVDISSLSCDSRTVTPGALFVAMPPLWSPRCPCPAPSPSL